MNWEILGKKLFKEWACLVLSIAGALLVWHLLPRMFSDEYYIDFLIRTGWNLGDFVFCALVISVYLVRAVLWTKKRISK